MLLPLILLGAGALLLLTDQEKPANAEKAPKSEKPARAGKVEKAPAKPGPAKIEKPAKAENEETD